MDPDELAAKKAVKVGGNAEAPRRKPYAPPHLTTYGHISKLTTGSSGDKNDGMGTMRACL